MDYDLDRLLREYAKDQTIAGRRPATIKRIKHKPPKFFTYLDESGTGLNRIGFKTAAGYQGWLLERKTGRGESYSDYYIRELVNIACGFCDFLKGKSILYANPFKEIRRIRVKKKLPRNILKEEQMNSLLDALSHFERMSDLKGRKIRYKVHVVAELMYATGLRISEAAGLKIDDIDFNRKLIEVREGKGGLNRVCFLNDYALSVLKLFITEMREALASEWNRRNRDLLFGIKPSCFEKMVNKNLKRAAEELGIENFSSHGFRHAVGFHLLRAGCNIRYIQAILGHKLLRNTEIYTKVDKKDLRKVLDEYHPRKWGQSKDA